MQFTSAVVTLAMMASSALAQIQIENIASFETYGNSNCEPPSLQTQNINSNTCYFLPQQSAKVFYLEKQRANCQIQFFTAGDCTGTATDTITSAPSACLNVATKFSFKATCV